MNVLYRVVFSDAVTEGILQQGDGPQRIQLPETRTVPKLTLKFHDSYGDYCPDAAEVQIFTEPVTENVLASFVRK